MSSNISSKAAIFLAGIGVGAVLTLLFAPKSGKETRRYIANKAGEGRDYVSARGKEIRRQAEDSWERGKDLLVRQKERLADALETVRKA